MVTHGQAGTSSWRTTLAATGQVGSAPELVFDDLARLAASVTGCGIAAITFVGEHRTYWKSVPHLPYGGPEAWQNAVSDPVRSG